MDSVSNQLHQHALQYNHSLLYIHFDKNVYTNNDPVWFTGYLISSSVDYNRHNTLYLSLVNNQDSSVVVQQKFLMDNGYVFGSLTLPDSLQSGSYRFVANTNVKINGKPDAEFIQQVLIKSTTVNPLTANLALFKIKDEQTGAGTVLFKALTSDNRFVPDAEVVYTIGGNGQVIKTGKAKTSVIGELMIDYPANKITVENNRVSVMVKKDKNIRYAHFDIPVEKRMNYLVNFYPESGHLISSLENKIGWEVKDLQGNPVSVNAILFGNDNIIDTVATNSIGIGHFSVVIKPNVHYKIRLLQDGKPGQDYELPESLTEGVLIKLNTAIGGHEMRALIESNYSAKIYVVVHDYHSIFLSKALALDAGIGQRLVFHLDSVPMGLLAISVLDETYRPIAERIFFSHYDELNTLQINSDRETYKTRDTVQLKLKIFGKDHQPLKGLVSIACVQSNRISVGNASNIVDYAYLQQPLTALPPNISGIKYTDLNYLEDVLLIKGWRTYKWPLTEKVEQEQHIAEYKYSGQVYKNKKLLKVPITLNTLTAGNINSFETDSSGRFDLPVEALLMEEKAKVLLNIGEQNYLSYAIQLTDPFDELKKYIVKQDYTIPQINRVVSVLGAENMLSSSGIKLKEVTITKTKDDFRYATGVPGINRCGDYVCMNGILNCQNHTGGGTQPVKGKLYTSNGRMVIYQGCEDREVTPNLMILKGVNLPKDFYVSDLSNTNEPINFSTVYWNYQVLIDAHGETPLTFNTGDLTGDFKISIQGMSTGGVVYGEKEIKILKP